MEPVPLVGWGFFPLDEQLELMTGNLTPTAEEHLVRLAAWMPFGRAAQMLQALTGVQVSEATVRRHTEQMGNVVETLQDEQSQTETSVTTRQEQAPKQLVMSADGAFVPLEHGVWAEVRTLAIGEVEQQGEQSRTRALSYFSRMSDANTFADRSSAETQQRQVLQAAHVAVVTDGAGWLQSWTDLHRPDATRILDFPHAAQRISAILETLAQAGQRMAPEALERCLHLLKHRGPRPVLRWLGWLTREARERGSIAEDLAYLHKREPLMQYPIYRAAGWPIGSGMVESANKLVMQARLKGAGMHWGPAHVNPMLALRTTVCNDRWHTTWTLASARRVHTRRTARLARTHQRQGQATQAFLLAWMRFLLPRTPPPAPAPLLSPRLPGRVAGRPTSHHPWKRFVPPRPKGSAKL